VSNPRRPAQIMRVDSNDVRLTVNGEDLDLSVVSMPRTAPIVCPGCKLRRPSSSAEYNAWSNAINGDPYPCCNPDCGGMWGTGCYHCHHPRFAGTRFDLSALSSPQTFPGRDGCSLARYAVLSVPGVTECNVESLRPGTVRVVVTGGENVAIAEALASALPIGVETIGRVEVEGRSNHVMRYVVRFDRPSASGFACEQCKGLGRRETHRFREGTSTPTSVPCHNCGGLGCVELAKWAHRNGYTITRRGDVLTVSRPRTRPIGDGWFNVDVSEDRPIVEGSLGVVLFWALAHELGGTLINSFGPGQFDELRSQYVVESIAACSRPLCRLPDLWEAQIDARLTLVVIDEVVDGRAVRRMGTLVEVARRRAETVRRRANEDLESAWNTDASGARFDDDGLDRYSRIGAEVEARTRQELDVIRDSIAGVDPYEPEWAAAWWLALREWTSAGKEPDADAMADILREFIDDCTCSHVRITAGWPDEGCPIHGDSRRETSLGYHVELSEVPDDERNQYDYEQRRSDEDDRT
jgi:hypothetical protein